MFWGFLIGKALSDDEYNGNIENLKKKIDRLERENDKLKKEIATLKKEFENDGT